MLSAISQTQKDLLSIYVFTYMWNLKKVFNEYNKIETQNIENHRYREQTSGLPVGRGGWCGQDRGKRLICTNY